MRLQLPQMYTNPELHDIEQQYAQGKFSTLEGKLEAFISQHKDAILHFKDTHPYKLFRTIPPHVAAKFFILEHQSIDMRTEMSMQLEEIEKEAYIRMDADHNRVAADWAKRFAAGWRSHYVYILEVLFEKNQNKYVALLSAAEPGNIPAHP
ncbi:hypothetical protein HY642_01710 [Candidatus Woesearchaeota archaeon]|nr:hypothetical protein [Candidatus Woesearchaeota archaeon]